MDITQFLLNEFTKEAARSRLALEQLPDGHADWKPHDRSMAFGYLAEIVATIPTWLVFQITGDELDIAPINGPTRQREPMSTRADYLAALEKGVADARAAFERTDATHLATTWRLKARGEVVQEAPRDSMIQDTLNHWSHHRGQLTVYLRMLGATVPALYGPSADDKSFGPQ